MATRTLEKTWGVFGSSVAAAALCVVVLARIRNMGGGIPLSDKATYGAAILAMGAFWAVFALAYDLRPGKSSSTKCFAFSPRTQNTWTMCSAGTLASLLTLTIGGMALCGQGVCPWVFKAFEGSAVLGVIAGILAALSAMFTVMSPDSLHGSSGWFNVQARKLLYGSAAEKCTTKCTPIDSGGGFIRGHCIKTCADPVRKTSHSSQFIEQDRKEIPWENWDEPFYSGS